MSAPALLNRAAVAARLNISPRTVTDIVGRREIEVVRVGNLLRFKPEAVDAYIERRRQPAAPVPPPFPPPTALQPLPTVRRKRFN